MGLLDQLFGNADQTQALGLLGANMMAGNTANGFAQAQGLLGGADERRLAAEMKRMQMENYKSEIEQRKQKMQMELDARKRQDLFLNGDPAGVSPGAFAPAADGVGPAMPQGAAPQAGGLIARARAMGIPEQAIQADVVFNGGKGISDMLFKRGTPSMKVSNGYAYDENRLNAGFLPQLNQSQDGKTSMVQIDPNTGMPVVSAPQGAQNTYAGYRNIDESAKANFDPVTVTPQGQNPQMTSRGALMRSPQVQGVQPAADAGRAEILNQEVTKAQAQLQAALRSGDATAAQRATNDLTALNRELGRAGGASRATVGMPLQSDAEKADELERVKAPSGYERTKDGLRALPGGPTDQKAQVSVVGQETVNDIISSLRDRFDSLNKAGGVTNTKNGVLSNLGAGVASSAPGQIAGRMFGTENQSDRNSIAMTRPLLLQAIMKATGMSAKQMDSNRELQLYLSTATDPTLDYQANVNALDILQRLYGSKKQQNGDAPNSGASEGDWTPTGKRSSMTSGGWSATLKK